MEKKSYKLGLAINAFEGTEHLYNIISEIRDLVDMVIVGLQEKSYLGDPIDETDVEEVKRLEEEGLVNATLWIKTDNKEFSRVQECNKRNQMIDYLEKNGCTHALVIDSDEFYTHNAFQRAKDKIYEEGIEVTYCRYLNYFGSGKKDDYKTYLVYPFHNGNFVPFISKIKYRFKWQCKDFPKPSDPTRRYVLPKVLKKDKSGKIVYKDKEKKVPVIDHYLVQYYEFSWNELKMHHFSWIRNDIRKKMRDWSSRVYFHEWFEVVDKATERFERFCNGEKEGEAILLFNTPDNKVELCNMENQYVFPKVDISERAIPVPNKNKKILSIDAMKNDWIDIIQIIASKPEFEWFLLYSSGIQSDEVSNKSKEKAQSETDDSISFAKSWKNQTIGEYEAMIPEEYVVLSRVTIMRMLSVDASLLELNDVCTPLEIVGLSLRRYFENIEVEYHHKLKELI